MGWRVAIIRHTHCEKISHKNPLCLCNKFFAGCVGSTHNYSGVYFFRNIFIQGCFYSEVYLFKDICIQGCIYSGVYLFRGIVIQGCLILACVVTLLLVSVVFVHACTATAFPLLSRISAKARDILGIG